ncbi:hypothetical protein LguiB_027927 [Lonicera macranthoides]
MRRKEPVYGTKPTLLNCRMANHISNLAFFGRGISRWFFLTIVQKKHTLAR